MAYIVVFAFQFILLYPLHTLMDLPLWDESNYMGQGGRFASGIARLPSLSSSPLYVLLYSIFVRLFGTVKSVFFMKYFLSVGVSLLVLTFLIQNLRSHLVPVLLSLLWSMSSYNIGAMPLVYHFGIFIFLLSLIYSSRLIAVVLLCLCLFIRLEYIFILIPYIVYLIISFIKNKKGNMLQLHSVPSKVLSLITLSISLTILLYLIVNIDSWDMGIDRTWFAFRQHYALAQVQAGLYAIDPWVDFNFVIDHDFPSSHSLLNALLVNPGAFLYHVSKNSMRLPIAVFGFVHPIESLANWVIYAVTVAFIAIASLSFVFCCCKYQFIVQLKNMISKPGQHSSVLSLVSLMALVPSLVVYAKSSYSLPLMPFVLLYLGSLYIAIQKSFNCESSWVSIVLRKSLKWGPLVLCCIIFIVALGAKPSRLRKSQRPVYDKVTKLTEIWPHTKVTLLGLRSSSYCNYIGWDKCVAIEPFATISGGDIESGAVSLRDLLTLHDPDALLINQQLLNSRNFNDDLDMLKSERWVMYDIGDEKIYFLRYNR